MCTTGSANFPDRDSGLTRAVSLLAHVARRDANVRHWLSSGELACREPGSGDSRPASLSRRQQSGQIHNPYQSEIWLAPRISTKDSCGSQDGAGGLQTSGNAKAWLIPAWRDAQSQKLVFAKSAPRIQKALVGFSGMPKRKRHACKDDTKEVAKSKKGRTLPSGLRVLACTKPKGKEHMKIQKRTKREQAFREAFFIKHGYFPKGDWVKHRKLGPRLMFGFNTSSK